MLVPIGIEYGDLINGTKCYVYIYIYTPSLANAMFNMVFVQKTMFDWGNFPQIRCLITSNIVFDKCEVKLQH